MLFLQMVPQISITGGQPTISLPLTFVIAVTMIKDIIEDSRRHKSDNKENNSEVLLIPHHNQLRHIHGHQKGVFKLMKWKHIKVGQIVKVKRDQYFPADMILLNSDDPQGICYVETKNLDGETNLKYKSPHKLTVPCTKTDEQVAKFNGKIKCQGPNEFLYKFEGNMFFKPSGPKMTESAFEVSGGSMEIPLDANNLLLRGSSLKNTDYVYGIVVYTGHECKIMKNSPNCRNKASKIE